MPKFLITLSRPKVLIAGGFLAAVILLLAFLVPLPASGTNSQQYAGSDTCATCHEDTVKAFQNTIHAQKGVTQKSDKGCETCHGPGAEHAEAGGDKTKIKSIAGLSTQEQSAICLQCHENGSQMFWAGSSHQQRNLACQTCHSVHAPRDGNAQLKVASESDLCFGCHKKQAGQFLRSSHHPIWEGKMSCSSCHNPHGSLGEANIDADSTPEICYQCHAEKRGPFLWEHIPVRENCANCHEPHGSSHIKLLNARAPFLCQRCHSDTRHPGTIYDQNNITSNRLFDRNCTMCHSMIHGSNHPSGYTFLR